MFESVFSGDNLFHLIEILFWLIGAFAIGLFFGYIIGNSKNSTNNNTFEEQFDSINTETDTSTIRAFKTFERGGVLSENKSLAKKETEGLDFEIIGIASEEIKDDLQKINGIGTATESKLNEVGIYTYEQISNLKSTDIEKLTGMINFFPGRIAKDDWIGQAIQLMNKEH
jgi:predicted flap endonuclease-1-like 5' DNA nuclease